MHRGYIKIWRKSIESGWLSNHKLWALWCYLILKATYKPCKVLIGFQEVELQPGQLIFGRKKCSKETGISEKSVRTCLQSLKTASMVAIKSASKYSIISIINWELYQNDEVENGQQNGHQTGQQRASNGPASGHIQTLETHKKKERECISIPEWIEKEIWEDFKEFRIRIKAPLTNRAIKNIIIELEKLKISGNNPNDVINQSITRGWRGVFPIRQDEFKKQDNTSSYTPPDRKNKIMQDMADRERKLRGET